MKRLIAALLCVSGTLLAHAGCYEAPGAHTAPHGGILEHTDHLLVELVDTVDPMEIYVLDGHNEPIPAKDLEIKADIQLPRHSRAQAEIQIEPHGDHHTAQLRTQGRVHRLTLILDIVADGERDQVRFEVEPQD